MQVLVLGGTQFNGLGLVHELVRQGHAVTILNRGQTEAVLPEGLQRLYGDRTDHDQMREVLGGRSFDAVYDLTAYHRGDVELMVDIFEGNTGHYIFASSTVIYAASDIVPIAEHFPLERGEAQIEYGQGKIDGEDFLRNRRAATGLPFTIVPFSMVFGPRNIIPDREQRMFSRLLEGRPILLPADGMTLLQVCHVDDQARALAALMGNDAAMGERVNITSPAVVTDIGYVSTMAEVLGVTPELQYVPGAVMDAMWDGELSFDHGAAAKMNIDIRSSDDGAKQRSGPSTLRTRFKLATVNQRLAPNIHRWNRSTFFSVEKLQRMTGWTPEHDLHSMIEHTFEWFQREGIADTVEFDWTFEDQILEYVRS